MSLWNESYQSSVDSISNYIENNFIHFSEIPDNIDKIDDSVFVDSILVVALALFFDYYIIIVENRSTNTHPLIKSS